MNFPAVNLSMNDKYQIKEDIITIPEILTEHLGRKSDLACSYKIVGNPDGPKVLVLGGLSADKHVIGDNGWWDNLFDSNGPISPKTHLIYSMDYFSGKGHSAQLVFDPAGETPLLTTQDQAKFIVAGLHQLGIQELDSVIGASLGGMVGLAIGELFPTFAKQLYILCAGFSSPPHSIGLRQLQRAIVRLGVDGKDAKTGVTLARALGMITYRSFDEFNQRFAEEPFDEERGIWKYLSSRGEAFADVFPTTSFLVMSQSIDYHVVKAENIRTPTKFWCVENDLIVPIDEVEQLSQHMPNAQVKRVQSIYAHDAFLKEIDNLNQWLS
jgi:homoserine O-acetyltransferase/O-succinyltransferase